MLPGSLAGRFCSPPRVWARFCGGVARLPVVDLAGTWGPNDGGSGSKETDDALWQRQQACADSLRRAAESEGFFYVVNHGVELDAVFGQSRLFFAQTQEAKMRSHASKHDGLRGYLTLYEQGGYGIDEADERNQREEDGDVCTEERMDCKEVFMIGHELPPDHPLYHPSLYSANHWPDDLPEFKRVVGGYYAQTSDLARHMFRLFAMSLGQPRTYFDKLVSDSPMDSMNMIRYPPLPASAPATQQGIGAHTDFECFTLLAQGPERVPGLEIFSSEQGGWRSVPPLPGALVVNIGDLMARWSNGRFRSTVHRAMNHGDRERFSIARFCACNFDTTISNLLSDEVAKFAPVVAGDHMLQRIGKANAAHVAEEP